MSEKILEVRQNFIQGLSRISQFWGFPKAMGAIYGALYLSPQPLSLDDLVKQVGVTKGAVSTNVRFLERLGMVHPHIQLGERKDYYQAETDFWKIVKGIIREREKSEFDRALRTVSESLETIESGQFDPEDEQLAHFYHKRLSAMQSFFHSLDNLVATVLALDELRLGALDKILVFRQNDKK
jgi:DNA-binding transcriptional regulator GbsR (MarR family)